LLGAAERVAVERREQRCHVKRSGGCYRQRDLAGPRNQVGEHVARQAEALAWLKRLYRAARENLRRRLDRQLVFAREREAFGSGDGETHGARSEANRRDRYSDRTALLGLEVQSLLAVLDAQRIVGRDRDFVTAGRPLDIVEVEPERRLVTEQHEARQRGGDYDRIPHHHVAGAMTNLVLAPGDRHHPHGAGKGRDGEIDFGGAVGASADDAGVKRERRLGRWAPLQLASAAIAA